MATERFEFAGGDGQQLFGQLESPDGTLRGWAVFAHCFTCTRESLGAVFISRALARKGIGVLRFDFTGLGESEGEFGAQGISGDISDLKAACEAMKGEGKTVSLLVGHSLGGAAVLHAAGQLSDVEAVATLGAPADPAHVLQLLGEQREEIESSGCAQVRIGGRPFSIRKGFIDTMEGHPWREAIGGLRRPLLIMHAPLDKVVGIDNAADIFAVAKHPKSFFSLDGADHLLSKRADAAWAAEVISAWADRYLPEKEEDEEFAGDEVLSITPGDAFRTRVRAGGHRLIADEPESVGGGGSGPSPYELLGAALASCTGMTLGMYARHKKLALDEVCVSVSHDRIHASDCEDCERRDGKVDRFERIVQIKGKLNEEERARLLEIADRCPVHRTLENEIQISTRQK